MKYYMLLEKPNTSLAYHKIDYVSMLENAEECERFDFTDMRAFRVIIDEKEYCLSKQYVFLKEKATLYILMLN